MSPLFACSKCGTVENTATSMYWVRGDGPALCSACDPKLGKWHGLFPRENADEAGYVLRAEDSPFLTRPTAVPPAYCLARRLDSPNPDDPWVCHLAQGHTGLHHQQRGDRVRAWS
jgi:hypothetical protein